MSAKALFGGVTHVGPAAAYVVIIFIGGSLSGGDAYGTMTDKQLHAVAFGVMVPLLARAVHYLRPALILPARLGVSAASSSAIGALLELWQAILPHRDADVLDWVADSIGAVAAGGMLVALAAFFGVLGVAGQE